MTKYFLQSFNYQMSSDSLLAQERKKKMKTRYLKKEKKMEFRKDRDDFELTVNGKLVTLNREY